MSGMTDQQVDELFRQFQQRRDERSGPSLTESGFKNQVREIEAEVGN